MENQAWNADLEKEVMGRMRFYDDFPKKGIKFLDIFSATEDP